MSDKKQRLDLMITLTAKSRLAKLARDSGLSMSAYVERLIQDDWRSPLDNDPSYSELCNRVRTLQQKLDLLSADFYGEIPF